MLSSSHTSEETIATQRARIVELEALLDGARTELEKGKGELEKLRQAYRRVLEELQLMRRRLFHAKAEREDVAATQLAFEGLLAEAEGLERALKAAEKAASDAADKAAMDAAETEGGAPPSDGDKPKPKPKGRRALDESKLPVIRVEITDPELEGTAERISFEESSRLGYERGGARRIVLARAVYKVGALDAPVAQSSEEQAAVPTAVAMDPITEPGLAAGAQAAPPAEVKVATPPLGCGAKLITAPLPKELFRRALLAPSMIAHILMAKYVMGTPFYRLEEKLAYDGARIDRGTMCRYAEDAGATLGAIVLAMRDEAMATAFCLSTDATGVSLQPTPLADGNRQACRKGHFFIVLADLDHVFFEYQPKHTSAAVCEMFQGFSGYIQADAHTIYDALFRGSTSAEETVKTDPPKEVGCWSHARRKFWEAAVCKYRIGVEGLRRINAIFAVDRALAKLPPAKRHALRQDHVRPLVEAFFDWAKLALSATHERGLVATALGYSVRQQDPLRRFLEDGRLLLDNNRSERGLRPIAVGRKSWLFCGSDDHASAAANLFSLVASCKLHALDPEAYLADIIRVMPYWSRDRYLELAPKYWARTRARLDPAELARPLGHITVPEPLPPEEKSLPR